MGVPHPFPYQGSKRNLTEYILQYFPEDAERLIEPFAGSAALSLAALFHKKVEKVVIGDSDIALAALWRKIITSPLELADAYSTIWYEQLGQERSFYDLIRLEFNATHRPDYFLYLLARCVKAAVRYNANGEFNQSPDNRRKGTHPDTMKKNILATSKLLNGRAIAQHADYRELLDRATQEDIVYLDPPYQGVCKNRDPRYKEKISFDNFVSSLNTLNARNISFIVSYDGRTEEKTYGNFLPHFLGLTHIELDAGRSSQATLLGRDAKTFEALYLSPALIRRINETPERYPVQIPLLEM
ncbi:MAG: DNA adenine methylase [Chloroflexi bacterium]|nr:DNA adenine methylase [Chloroflexota bacterium]